MIVALAVVMTVMVGSAITARAQATDDALVPVFSRDGIMKLVPRSQIEQPTSPTTTDLAPPPATERHRRPEAIRTTQPPTARRGPAPRDLQPSRLPGRRTSTPVAAKSWSHSDIVQARAVCRHVIAKYAARITHLKPIKRGACGNPAPVLLKSLGGRAGVTFDPPAKLNCPMVAALARWIGRDLQPLAKKHLRAKLKSVSVMSDYSCRNVYGRKRGRLSQHARANALDIRGFTTTDNRNTLLLSHWGPTRRGIRRYIAAVKRKRQRAAVRAAAAAKQKAPTQAAKKTKAPRPAVTVAQPDTQPAVTSASIVPTLSLKRGTIAPNPNQGASMLSFGQGLTLGMSKLGGPKRKRKALRTPTAATGKISLAPLFRSVDGRRRRFLKAAHATACRHFGTVLGPEFDSTHRNHFHVDLARRKHGTFCR